MRFVLPFFLVLFVCSGVFASEAEIRKYDIEINLSKDTVMSVTESIHVTLKKGQKEFVRIIPVLYHDKNGVEYSPVLDGIDVPGEKFKVQLKNNLIYIRIKNKSYGNKKVYVINYRLYGAADFNDGRSTLFWKLLSGKERYSIKLMNYTLKLPKVVQLRNGDYFVITGSLDKDTKGVDFGFDGLNLYGGSVRALKAGENIFLDMSFPRGYLIKSGKPIPFKLIFGGYMIIIYAFVISAALFWYWFFIGKDRKIPVHVTTRPPLNINSAEGAFLVLGAENRYGLVSLLISWGIKGYIKIQSVYGKDFIIYKLKELGRNHKNYEQAIFSGLFKEGKDIAVLSELEGGFYMNMIKSSNMLEKHVLAMTNRNHKPSPFTNLYFLAALGFVVYSIVMVFVDGNFQWLLFGLITFISVMMFGRLMPKSPPKAKGLTAEMAGFAEFLKSPDSDNIAEMLQQDKDYYIKTLPFAVAFGHPYIWSRLFNEFAIQPLEWFVDKDDNPQTPLKLGEALDEGIEIISHALNDMPDKK